MSDERPKRGRPRERDIDVGLVTQAYEQAVLNRRRANRTGLATQRETAEILGVSESTLKRTLRDRGGRWGPFRRGYISDQLAESGRPARKALRDDPDAVEYADEAAWADPSYLQVPQAFYNPRPKRR